PQPGYAIDDDNDNTWSYDYYPVVTPKEPNRNGNSITIPTTEGITYSIDGEEVTGEINIPLEGVTVTTDIADKYLLADNAITSWSFEYDPIEVIAEQPARAENVITIPAVEGITYTANGEEVTGDIEVPHDSFTIEAHANDGY